MATLFSRDNRRRPWVAKRSRRGQHYHLGYYATREEAEPVEAEFDRRRPLPPDYRRGIRRFA